MAVINAMALWEKTACINTHKKLNRVTSFNSCKKGHQMLGYFSNKHLHCGMVNCTSYVLETTLLMVLPCRSQQATGSENVTSVSIT